MKKLIFITTIVGSFTLGFSLSFLLSKKESQIESCIKVNEPIAKELQVKKGGVYTRQSFVDKNDPFNIPIIDTITVIDLQTSKNKSDLIYVKWTFNNWNDTSKFLSTELTVFENGLEEIK